MPIIASILLTTIIHQGIAAAIFATLGVATMLGAWQMYDNAISRLDALVLFVVFVGVVGWSIWQCLRNSVPARHSGDDGVDRGPVCAQLRLPRPRTP